jgi:GT2 family glycosyltransferase
MTSSARGTGEPDGATAVQVVIVAWNSGVHLQKVLDALDAQTFTDFEVTLWDNASTDGAAVGARLPARTTYVDGGSNLGFAVGNNRAAALGESRWIATLNPDAVPEPGWLGALVAAGEATGAASVGSVQLLAEDPSKLDGLGDVYSVSGFAWRGGYLRPRAEIDVPLSEISSPCAAAALYRRDAFEDCGGFDERFFCYFEDVDLGLRLRLRGGRNVLTPDAVVHHVGSASSSTVSGFAEYHGARNGVWSFAKTMPAVLLPVALPLFVGLHLFLLVSLSRHREYWVPRARCLRDGVRGVAPFLRDRPLWRPRHLRGYLRGLSWNPLDVTHRPARLRPLER